MFRTTRPGIVSQEIDSISLHNPIPLQWRIYGLPFLGKWDLGPCIRDDYHEPVGLTLRTAFYPVLYYTYYYRYDDWVKSEEWSFIYCVLLFAGHALSFLITAWNSAFNARVSYTSVGDLEARKEPQLTD